MAKLVTTVGLPHSPYLPGAVLREGPESESAQVLRNVASQFEAENPDLIIMLNTDHMVGLSLANMPAFCISLADEATGPADDWIPMPQYTVRMQDTFARGLLEFALESEFDLASAEEFKLDHGVMVPLHFLTPHMEIPVVPINIRGHIPPLPLAKRCIGLGRMIRDFIEAWPGRERVAVVASGEFSLELGTPRSPNPDLPWAQTVTEHFRDGRVEELAKIATTEQMLAAGNVSSELLNWITMAAVVGDQRPEFIQSQLGHAFAAWRLGDA